MITAMISSAIRTMRIGVSLMLFMFLHGAAWGQSDREGPATVVWLNSFYGPNNSGLGLAARYGAIGGGATVFGFAGDTTIGVGIRPGIIGASFDAYLTIDCTRWLAIYGNIGVGAWLRTYEQPGVEQKRTFPSGALVSLGGGMQISLASHVMLGIGGNALLDTPEKEGGPVYKPIPSVVAQVGYRL